MNGRAIAKALPWRADAVRLRLSSTRKSAVTTAFLDHSAPCTGAPLVPGMTRRVLRGISAVLCATVLNMALLPLAQAVQHARAQAAAAPASADGSQRYAQALQTLQASLANEAAPLLRGRPAMPVRTQDLDALAHEIQARWQTERAAWQAAGVDAAVQGRQAALEAAFHAQHAQLVALLQPLQADGTDAAARARLKAFLAKELPPPPATLLDPRNLPWKVELAQPREPALDAGMQEKDLPAPTAADLAQTPDAPHTADIKALAQSLGNNPHKIYQWVHDHIHYVPTQGSVQGAQDTLDKKAGNAFDTASLLIALLRSAGIAARYVYGTVEVPVAQAQNWVGGAQTASAAQQILGQGGVPNMIVTKAGQDYAIRLEHVWVEALIQYQPGRGARHVPGQSEPDTWVPMDGSYKQYTFQNGMDLQTAVPLDAQALLTAAQQGAEVNEAEGWVRNLNSAALEQQLKTYQSQLKNYIDSQNGGQSTVGDVLGRKSAQIDPLPYLAGTLPYTIKARSQQFSEIPESRRAKFKYAIYADQRSAAWGESPLLNWQAATAELAGKKVTLAWVAASAADEAAIAALIPTPPAGQQLDPSQLPRGLSSSIRLRPEIRVEGQTVATGQAMGAGSEPIGQGGFTRYGSQEWDETQDQLIAGQQTALGLSIQGVSQVQMETLKTRMEQTKAKLEQAQAAPESQRATILQNLTGEHLTGDMLTATLWGYFASLQSHGAIAAIQARMFDRPALSYGLFHAQVKPNKLYGIVTTGITFQGLNMDIGHLRSIRWVQDDDPQSAINNKPELRQNGKTAAQNRWIAYNKMRGQYSSAMEHAVPEQFWVDKSQCRYMDENGQIQNPTQADCAQAVSAVKALAIAQAEGQRIYTINQSNAATALPKLSIGGDVGTEIRNAIQAGKEVTFHERQISAHGWTGYGYVITDPDTGAGAYLIEGGGNGAILILKIIATLALVVALVLSMPTLGLVALGATLGPWLTLTGFVASVLATWLQCGDNNSAFNLLLLLRMTIFYAATSLLVVVRMAGNVLPLVDATIVRLTGWGANSLPSFVFGSPCD